jgi:hypothetical protein
MPAGWTNRLRVARAWFHCDEWEFSVKVMRHKERGWAVEKWNEWKGDITPVEPSRTVLSGQGK